jgi:hypothetical protein
LDNPAEVFPLLPPMDMSPLPQGVVNAAVGLGDGVISALTFGKVSGQDVRNLIPYTRGSNGGANVCSGVYRGAYAIGVLDTLGAEIGAFAVAADANAIRGAVASLGLITGGGDAAAAGAEIPSAMSQLESYLQMAQEEALTKPIVAVP